MAGRYGQVFPPYIPVRERAANAARYIRQQAKAKRVLQPVLPTSGGTVATTFWGRAWCDGLEAQADIASRLARGLSYVRHGAVVDLQLVGGEIAAEVLGSEPYRVQIIIKPLPQAKWAKLVSRCHAEVGSLVDLLRGNLSAEVMRSLTEGAGGLVPRASEVTRRCSCPDPAALCKHMAAVLYAIGARLDSQPLLLFALRQVDARQLTAEAGAATSRLAAASPAQLADQDLGVLFDIDLGAIPPSAADAPAEPAPRRGARRPASGQPPGEEAASAPPKKLKAARRLGDRNPLGTGSKYPESVAV